MPKLKPAFFVLLICALCFLISVINSYASDESLTITTYYPSPYGSYRELRSQMMAIGANYYSGSYTCWPGGSCTYPIPAAASLIVEGNVGIGTTSPSYKLHTYTTSGPALYAQTTDTTNWAALIYGGNYGLYANGPAYGLYGSAASGYGVYGYGGSYGGYFYGGGGVYAQNTSGYYAFLGYPGSYWSVLANGNMYASDYYIAAIGRWASQLGQGGTPRAIYECPLSVCDNNSDSSCNGQLGFRSTCQCRASGQQVGCTYVGTLYFQ